METSTALKIFRDYQKPNPKLGIIISYRYLLDNFEELFGERDLESISSEEIFQFLEIFTENNFNSTKTHRYSQMRAFFKEKYNR